MTNNYSCLSKQETDLICNETLDHPPTLICLDHLERTIEFRTENVQYYAANALAEEFEVERMVSTMRNTNAMVATASVSWTARCVLVTAVTR